MRRMASKISVLFMEVFVAISTAGFSRGGSEFTSRRWLQAVLCSRAANRAWGRNDDPTQRTLLRLNSPEVCDDMAQIVTRRPRERFSLGANFRHDRIIVERSACR